MKPFDSAKIMSGVFEGITTGSPIQLLIENVDHRSKDYGDIVDKFRPGHADITYWQKYGIRDYRGGGRSSARETASRVAAGAIAREALNALLPKLTIKGYLVQIGNISIDWGGNMYFGEINESLIDWVKSKINEGIDLHEIIILSRDINDLKPFSRKLKENDISCWELDASSNFLYNEVGLASVRRVKGLEYRCVAIVNCNDDQFPLEKELLYSK